MPLVGRTHHGFAFMAGPPDPNERLPWRAAARVLTAEARSETQPADGRRGMPLVSLSGGPSCRSPPASRSPVTRVHAPSSRPPASGACREPRGSRRRPSRRAASRRPAAAARVDGRRPPPASWRDQGDLSSSGQSLPVTKSRPVAASWAMPFSTSTRRPPGRPPAAAPPIDPAAHQSRGRVDAGDAVGPPDVGHIPRPRTPARSGGHGRSPSRTATPPSSAKVAGSRNVSRLVPRSDQPRPVAGEPPALRLVREGTQEVERCRVVGEADVVPPGELVEAPADDSDPLAEVARGRARACRTSPLSGRPGGSTTPRRAPSPRRASRRRKPAPA